MQQGSEWALVTGASSGLGHALAKECAARGMNVFLAALPESGLPDVSRAIAQSFKVAVEWMEVDLTEPDAAARLFARVRSAGARVDLLVNNAGIGSIGRFAESDLDEQEAIIRLNVMALVRLTRAFVGEMRNGHRTHILNVGSLSAFFPMPYLPVYSATKSFVVNFSLALRSELAGSVGVSVLCPNTIRNDRAVSDYIDRLDLASRMACLTPECIARVALDGVARNRAIIVPGRLNRLLHLCSHLIPRTISMRAICHYWGKYGQAEKEGAVRACREAEPRAEKEAAQES